MLQILFFAAVREEVGCSALNMECGADTASVSALVERLAAERGPEATAVLRQENTVVAVNQEVVHGDHPLQDGDEVAFFPPVTGG